MQAEMPIPVEPVDYGMEDYNGDEAKANVADGGTWVAPVNDVIDVGVAIRVRSTGVVVHDAEDHVTANQIQSFLVVSVSHLKETQWCLRELAKAFRPT